MFVSLSLSIVLAGLFKRGMVELVTASLHHRFGRGFDSRFLLFLCFRFSLLSPRFRPPREAGAANVAALASGLFLGVSSPKGIWDSVDVAALASG